MFLALHHSARAALFWLLERCFWRLRYYLFPTFLRPIQGENKLGLLPLPLCFVEQNEDFHGRKYCAVVFQSGGFCFCLQLSRSDNDAMEG